MNKRFFRLQVLFEILYQQSWKRTRMDLWNTL